MQIGGRSVERCNYKRKVAYVSIECRLVEDPLNDAITRERLMITQRTDQYFCLLISFYEVESGS